MNGSSRPVSRVPRWRMRKEQDDIYNYYKLREAALHFIRETFKTERAKRPGELIVDLENDDFEGWTLEWERIQVWRHKTKKITSKVLKAVYKGSIQNPQKERTQNYLFFFNFQKCSRLGSPCHSNTSSPVLKFTSGSES